MLILLCISVLWKERAWKLTNFSERLFFLIHTRSLEIGNHIHFTNEENEIQRVTMTMFESSCRLARLHLGEAAGGPGSPARARSGAAGVSLPAQLPSPHCFPDLGPRRRPAEEGVGSAPGGRRRGALWWLRSKVPSRPRLPVGPAGRPAVGGGGGDSRRATPVEQG